MLIYANSQQYDTHKQWRMLLHAECRDVIGWSVAGRGISTAECSWTTVIER